jgi:dGTP triphosphohydrolase
MFEHNAEKIRILEKLTTYELSKLKENHPLAGMEIEALEVVSSMIIKRDNKRVAMAFLDNY